MDKNPVDIRIMHIARVCHAVKQAQANLTGNNLPDWDNPPDEMQRGTMDLIFFYLKNKNVSPEVVHNNWVQSCLKANWRYGEKLDTTNKVSPYLIDYNKLDMVTKMEDAVIKSIILEMAVVLEM